MGDTSKAVLRGKFIVIQRPTKIKERNISNKKPNPTAIRTGGTTANKAQSKQIKEGNNQDHS